MSVSSLLFFVGRGRRVLAGALREPVKGAGYNPCAFFLVKQDATGLNIIVDETGSVDWIESFENHLSRLKHFWFSQVRHLLITKHQTHQTAMFHQWGYEVKEAFIFKNLHKIGQSSALAPHLFNRLAKLDLHFLLWIGHLTDDFDCDWLVSEFMCRTDNRRIPVS